MGSKIITISYSELDTFRQCPLKHALAYRQRWSKPAKTGSPLSKGTDWHTVLETHYRRLRELTSPGHAHCIAQTRGEILLNEKAILADCAETVKPLLSRTSLNEAAAEQQDLMRWMYEGYVAYHGADPEWEIRAVEYKTTVPLMNEAGKPSRFRLKVKIDLIVWDREMDGLWLIDHKSGADLPNDFALDMDDQFGLYEVTINRQRKAKGLQVVTGTIHNAARTTRNTGDYPVHEPRFKPQTLEKRHLRSPMNRTLIELENIEKDAFRAARAAYSAGNKVPYSSPDPRTCGWKCDFKEPHLIARKGGPIAIALADYGMAQDFARH